MLSTFHILLVLIILGRLESNVLAFAPRLASSTRSSSLLLQAVELQAEPDGGEELKPFDSMPDCRMKKMKEVDTINSDDGQVYEFWLTAVADGALVKEIRSKVLKDASKKANFPGFRKVRILLP